jgi:hypothetical protein
MTAATASGTSDLVARIARDVEYVTPERPAPSYSVQARPGFSIRVSCKGGRWEVLDRETGIFGIGDDASDAIRDFQRAVREHLNVLEGQASLSDELAAQLTYLRLRAS